MRMSLNESAAQFLEDCRWDGAHDCENIMGDTLPTVDELVSDHLDVWLRDEIGAEYGPDVQLAGLRAWAEAWHARGVRHLQAAALSAADYCD